MSKEGYTPEQLESLAKERPKNETDKRFVLSKEAFAQERMQAVKESVDEIKEKHNEVLSFCMFGSMTKGTAHEGSDIDGYLYIDSARVAQKEAMPEEKVLDYIQNDVRNDAYLTEEIAKKYILEFRNNIQERTGLKEKDVEHIRSRPISEHVIDKEIETLLTYYAGLERYTLESDTWFDSRPPRGSSVDEMLAYQKSKPVRPEYKSPTLGNMFHLEIGGGIRKYRKMFIDKLSTLGSSGEKIWTDTIRGTEMLENNFSTDETKHYPRTLAEAIEVYGK